MPGGPKILTRALLIALVLSAGALDLPFIPESQAVPRDCGETTLDGTIVRKQDGTLECGPGEGITVREDLAQAGAGRDQRRKPFKAFFTIADLQLADEESPARGEWADACEDQVGTKGAFRPHEAFVPHLNQRSRPGRQPHRHRGKPRLAASV
ncbi:MAG: hypothetical protein KY429_02415 [Actinobacteria bacterium]|nr:hypothetical protein [Actinomycetota bacterium]